MGGLAVVTGGAVRLGAAISKTLADAGYTVLIHAFSHEEEARRLSDELGGLHVLADLANPSELDTLFGMVEDHSEPLKVWVNNAAIFQASPPESVSMDMWQRHLNINLTAPFLCCQFAAKTMVDGGSIVNLLDVAALRPYEDYVHYAATKAGLVALTRGFAASWAPRIRVNGVAPGAALLPTSYSQSEREAALSRTPMAQEMGADAIAETVRFLVDGPNAITGEIINVDGGQSACL